MPLQVARKRLLGFRIVGLPVDKVLKMFYFNKLRIFRQALRFS